MIMVLKSPAGVLACHVLSLRENATDFGFLLLLLQALPQNSFGLGVLFLCHPGVCTIYISAKLDLYSTFM